MLDPMELTEAAQTLVAAAGHTALPVGAVAGNTS
jgi:hypothetical protein